LIQRRPASVWTKSKRKYFDSKRKANFYLSTMLFNATQLVFAWQEAKFSIQ